MSIIVKLREYKNLPEAENQVCNYILKHLKEVLNMTVYDIAKVTYTSPATVVRLCKKLDVKGFNKFKIILASEISSFDEINLNVLDTTIIAKEDSPHEIIEKITSMTLQSIQETRILINEKEFIDVAKLIMEKPIIDFYGVGASNIVAMDATYKFMRIGKTAISFQLYDRQYVQAKNSNKDHLGVIVSYSGETKEMIDIAKILQENDTKVVTITSSSSNSLKEFGDFNLFVSAKETLFRSGAITSRTSQLYVIDILYTLCTSLDYNKVLKNISNTIILAK